MLSQTASRMVQQMDLSKVGPILFQSDLTMALQRKSQMDGQIPPEMGSERVQMMGTERVLQLEPW